MKPSEILARTADVAEQNDDWMSFIVLADFCLEHGHRYERVAPYGRISDAGPRRGIEGERSGLWAQFARVIHEVRPRFVVVENVAALLVRGMGRVVGDLASVGYDAEWHCIPAAGVGAPHIRAREFILAYAGSERGKTRRQTSLLSRRVQLELRPRWLPEPNVGRVVHGLPDRVDRIRALGNAVVPQVAEVIGRVVMLPRRPATDHGSTRTCERVRLDT